MAPKAPANPASRQPKVKRHFQFSRIFKSGRMLGYAIIFFLFFCIDAGLLGLVAEQIHKHGGRERFDYPAQEYGHAMGLLLFSSIFGLLVSLFHWYFSTTAFAILFLILAVFNGTGAGIFWSTPFGKSLNCQKPAEFFPDAYQPYLNDCSRVMAISGLAWALFGLAVIGLVYTIFDRFNFSTKNTKAYDIEAEPTVEETKGLNRAESHTTNNTAHTGTNTPPTTSA